MKNIYFLTLGLLFGLGMNAQIVDIPDANFKAKLLASDPSNNIAEGSPFGTFIKIDANNNGEIEASEALAVIKLRIDNSNIEDLTGIKSFINLRRLMCSNNQLTGVDFSGMKLTIVVLNNNNLQNIDLSETNVTHYHFDNNLLLLSFNVKNQFDEFHAPPPPPGTGTPDPDTEGVGISFLGTPNLSSICADEFEVDDLTDRVALYGYICNVSSYCTIEPGGNFSVVQGQQRYDADGSGCDILDPLFGGLHYKLTNPYYNVRNEYSNSTGNYLFYVGLGSTTIVPKLESSYFDITPSSLLVNSSMASPITQNFCVVANGFHPDLEITYIPLTSARPGYNATYKIIYKNKGTQTQSGSVNLNFDDSVFDFVMSDQTAVQSPDNLTWTFTGLAPFETRTILVVMNLNSPNEVPAVVGGEVLFFTASITSPEMDETQNDNISTFYQTVVNSLDPNDKTCIEGRNLPPELAGTYVHYVIRFENTGTANAQNIVVKDKIDTSKFDITSLIPLDGSHPFTTRITEGNKVEFRFEDIQLPFDDASNDGYLTFKIKTLPTLVAGDTFSNTAGIYFDYNAPIVTNTATTILHLLGVDDFTFENYFTLYPNPAKDILNIKPKQNLQISSVSIYNTLGQLVLVVPNATEIIDVSSLTAGNYFIKIHTDKGNTVARFLKK
ncbi:T9SS type A sorting domain-containing protein [Flavobacterium sp. 3HN19-14]|uniref:T9SS type A sorting domain-containing protein n=1 Tax=Flavobacterium sp. 3HN19-14 TaxID=3448133 RepID=UPI003EDEB72A